MGPGTNAGTAKPGPSGYPHAKAGGVPAPSYPLFPAEAGTQAFSV
jgi:hypothetical protein